MSFEEHEQERKAILRQRENDAIRRLGLPVLKPGMSHNAAAIELRRAVRRMEVSDRILKASQQEKQQPPQPTDPAEGTARALLAALECGGEQKTRAEAFLKTAHPQIKAKLLELAGASSQWKERRSNKTNGF